MRLAVLTGASSGIGAALAKLLSRSDCRVIAVARRKELLEKVAKEGEGDNIQPVVADVSSPEGQKAICDVVGDSQVDFLIHNAGGTFI